FSYIQLSHRCSVFSVLASCPFVPLLVLYALSHSSPYSFPTRRSSDLASRLFNICQYGGIGRRARLKILFLLGVSVRSRLLVLDELQIIDVLTVFKTC